MRDIVQTNDSPFKYGIGLVLTAFGFILTWNIDSPLKWAGIILIIIGIAIIAE